MPRRWWIILLLLPLILGCASCQWHEAKEVIAMADSIDQTQHVIYDDTAALGGVIRTLDNPLGKLLMSNTLGKAYYYMGRNLDDYYQRFSDAAECYIKADRLHINDPIYRGRVNSCMGYICGQNNRESLALIFYERAGQNFKESGNEWRFAHNLLSISENYIHLHQLPTADSILNIAKTFKLDSNYLGRFEYMRGLYFYKQQSYDSATVHFNYCEDIKKYDNYKCYLYIYLMRLHLRKDELNLAVPYALFIVKNSTSNNLLYNAYYCLELDAENKNDTKLLGYYAHARADIGQIHKQEISKYTAASTLLESYLSNPHPRRKIRIILFSTFVICILLITSIAIYRNHATMMLYASNKQIIELSTQLKEQNNLLNYDTRISKIATKYSTPPNRWNQYHLLKKDIAPYLHDWLNALDRLDLTNREKVFCVFIFIYPHLPMSKIAYYMNNTENAVRVLKTRIAQKMGISSAELLNFLKQVFYTN